MSDKALNVYNTGMNYHGSFVVSYEKEPLILKRCHAFNKMFIVVKSFVLNYGRRNVIRKTWGKTKCNFINIIFVIGKYADRDILLETELNAFDDILLLWIEDKYENIVYKTIYAMIWITTRDVKSRFYHFIDDDRFLNVEELFSTAVKTLSSSELKIVGHKLSWSLPHRTSKDGKNVIDQDDYPYLFYPPYIIGGTMLTNRHTIDKIVKGFHFIKLIHVEDCYIGMIAYAMSIDLTHEPKFLPSYTSPAILTSYISAPGYEQPYQFLEAWIFLTKFEET